MRVRFEDEEGSVLGSAEEWVEEGDEETRHPPATDFTGECWGASGGLEYGCGERLARILVTRASKSALWPPSLSSGEAAGGCERW